jgi:hypothetical protein
MFVLARTEATTNAALKYNIHSYKAWQILGIGLKRYQKFSLLPLLWNTISILLQHKLNGVIYMCLSLCQEVKTC